MLVAGVASGSVAHAEVPAGWGAPLLPSAASTASAWRSAAVGRAIRIPALDAPAALYSSARVHALHAAATDYELGAGVLPMPAHLALDTAIGTGLIPAGLAMRDEPAPVRALPAGMG